VISTEVTIDLVNWKITFIIYLSIYLSTHAPTHLLLYNSSLDLGRFFSFLISYTDSSTPWTADQPVARPLPAQTQTTMGFEPTISVFERAKTVHALDRAATVIGYVDL
jgi:hypothetical protein